MRGMEEVGFFSLPFPFPLPPPSLHIHFFHPPTTSAPLSLPAIFLSSSFSLLAEEGREAPPICIFTTTQKGIFMHIFLPPSLLRSFSLRPDSWRRRRGLLEPPTLFSSLGLVGACVCVYQGMAARHGGR